MPELLVLVVLIIVVALFFDFTNGFHDAANAIAASVSTGTLTPRVAILMSAILNFVGALTGTGVASTIGKGIIDPSIMHGDQGLYMVLSALLAAIGWNLFTWWYGLPSSSSHALIGGIIGGAVAGYGWNSTNWRGVEAIILSFVTSPIIGGVLSFTIMVALMWIFRRTTPVKVTNMFRPMQVLSAAFMAFAHGTNDAQKSMGIITMALFILPVNLGGMAGHPFVVPLWVKTIAAIAMGLGTSAGGWKIIKTMGSRIVKLQPINGFASDAAASTTVLAATIWGLPVSTTHVVSGAIMGVGATKRLSAVRWGVAGNMLLAWVLTIPITALLAGAIYSVLRHAFGF
ncbi:MAG TPA: inorganic phosphate transporter [Oscillatoriaceae cyanobacterium]